MRLILSLLILLLLVAPATANIEIIDVDAPASVAPGSNVTMVVTIRNNFGYHQPVILVFNDVPDDMNLDPGESPIISPNGGTGTINATIFVIKEADMGDHTFELRAESQDLMVTEWVEQQITVATPTIKTEKTSVPESTPRDSPGPSLLWVLAAFVAAGGVSVLRDR